MVERIEMKGTDLIVEVTGDCTLSDRR